MDRYSLTTLFVGAIAIALVSGCNSSGIPRFVKYTPDSQALIFADAIYQRCYAQHIPTGKTHTFDGWFACEAPSGRKWVVVEQGALAASKDFCLVELDKEGQIMVTSLPSLSGMFWRRAIKMAFGPGQRQISLLMRPDASDWRVLQLTIGDEQWRELQAGPQRRTEREYIEHRTNGSITSPGHLPPSAFTFAMSSQKVSTHGGAGENVHCARLRFHHYFGFGNHLSAEYRLDSPDGSSFVTIELDDPPFARGTGRATLHVTMDLGHKRVLMPRNDWSARAFQTFFGSNAVVLLFLPVLL